MVGMVVLAAFVAALICAAVSDLLTMTIPNKLTLFIAGLFPLAALSFGLPMPDVFYKIAVALTVLITAFGFFALGWLGGGDAKLAAGVALWFGFDLLIPWLLSTAIFGGALTIIILVMRQFPLPVMLHRQEWALTLHAPTTGIPYGIAISAGALTVLPSSKWIAALY